MSTVLETVVALATTKLQQLQTVDPKTALRRTELLALLSKDEELNNPKADVRAVILKHAEANRANWPALTSVDLNGDVGFFIVIHLPFATRAKFKNLILNDYESPFYYEDDDIRFRAAAFLDKTQEIDQQKVIVGMIEASEVKYFGTYKMDQVMRFWQQAQTGKKSIGWENEVEEHRKRFAGTLVGKFNDAVYAMAKESEDSYNAGRGATLKKGVSGLMRSFVRNDRVMLKDISENDFKKAVRRHADESMERGFQPPSDNAIEDASTFMWEALKKLRDQDKGWRSHRAHGEPRARA